VSPVPEAIRRYFHGVNEEDWDDFHGIWCDDAVIEVVGGIRVQGWDEILPYYTRALSGFPVHHDDPYKVHVAGDTVTVEIAFTGETADGVPTTFEAVDVFTLEDGLVRRLTTWYDLDRVMRFVRTPGPPQRRARSIGAVSRSCRSTRTRSPAISLRCR
jgi:ketosteroid isomerase-like protein